MLERVVSPIFSVDSTPISSAVFGLDVIVVSSDLVLFSDVFKTSFVKSSWAEGAKVVSNSSVVFKSLDSISFCETELKLGLPVVVVVVPTKELLGCSVV